MTNLLHNDTIARALSQAIARGDAALENVPGLLRRIITEDMWQDRVIPESGQPVHFDHFEKFVTTEPLEGLGTTLDVINALCDKDKDVLQLIEELINPRQQYGTNRHTSRVDMSTLETQGGNSRSYRISVLKRDTPEIAERVIAGEISAAEGWRQAGHKSKRPAIAADDPKSAAQTILKYMDRAAIAELLAILADAIAERE